MIMSSKNNTTFFERTWQENSKGAWSSARGLKRGRTNTLIKDILKYKLYSASENSWGTLKSIPPIEVGYL